MMILAAAVAPLSAPQASILMNSARLTASCEYSPSVIAMAPLAMAPLSAALGSPVTLSLINVAPDCTNAAIDVPCVDHDPVVPRPAFFYCDVSSPGDPTAGPLSFGPYNATLWSHPQGLGHHVHVACHLNTSMLDLVSPDQRQSRAVPFRISLRHMTTPIPWGGVPGGDIATIPNQHPDCVGSTTKSFSFTGEEQSMALAPSSEIHCGGIAVRVTVELWGAAGGGGTPNSDNCKSGAGGYTHATHTLAAVPAGTRLTVVVGGGGTKITFGQRAAGGFGGGGLAGATSSSGQGSAGGGGFSGVFIGCGLTSCGSVGEAHDKALAIAGGGGGTYYHCNPCARPHSNARLATTPSRTRAAALRPATRRPLAL